MIGITNVLSKIRSIVSYCQYLLYEFDKSINPLFAMNDTSTSVKKPLLFFYLSQLKVTKIFSIILLGLLVQPVRVFSQDILPSSQPNLKHVSIGISNNPPVSFISKNGKYKGYVVDVLEEIAHRSGYKITWKLHSWHEIIKKVENNEIDVIGSMAFTKKRAQTMIFSKNSFFVGWSQVYLPVDSKIESFLDLDNKKIAIMKGDINGENLLKRCEKFEIRCISVEVENYNNAFLLVEKGQVDAAVANNLVSAWYSNKQKVLPSSIVFDAVKGYIAVSKDSDADFLNAFDDNMSQWKKQKGSFIYQKQSMWLRPKFKITHSNFIGYIVFGLILFSLLTFFSAVIFKRQVARRVKEISVKNEQFNQIINLVPHIIYVADEKGNILLANKKAAEYFGMTSEEIERCNIENYKNQQKAKNFLNGNCLSKTLGSSELKEVKTIDYNDNKYTLLLSKKPFSGSKKSSKAHVIVAVNITDLKEYEKKIVSLAHYSQVTGLPNKALFKIKIEESIKAAKKQNKHGALLLIDIDAFNKVNDLHGYNIGDTLLNVLVKRFSKNLKEYKTIAHFGGDEFVIDIPQLHEEAVVAEVLAVQYAELVQAMITRQLTIEEMAFQVTACVGIVIYPRDGRTEGQLIQRLGTALNEAKNRGRNKLELFDRSLENKIKMNHYLESELKLALEENQFVVYYQPILSAHTNQVLGAEALVRWNHPVKGIIAPGEFVEVAEKIRLIVRMGDWVLEEACKRIRENIIAGRKDFFIAVNVSVLQIKNKYFLPRISKLIKKYNIPSNYIELEITESVLMEDVDLSIYIFNKIKELGVKISIDDFGTGYSSFSYLMKLPIDKIKIDQSFVKDLPEDTNSATIVRTIIKMAQELGMKVVAEGIETQEQYEFLINEGCQFFQGYHLHRPMEYNQILEKSLI